MEEILKKLQGKSITKKSLFDFLSEINLEELSSDKPKNSIIYNDIVIHPIKEQIQEKKQKEKKPPPELKCEACMKVFYTQISLDNHHKNVIVCKKWIELPKKPNMINLTKGIHLIIDDLLKKSITDNNNLECKFCKYIFSTKGNLHKHFNTSPLCNSMAYDEFKKLVNSFNT
jgi:hypothetical protein